MDEMAIRLDRVSVRFNMSRERVDSMKEYLIRAVKQQLFFDEFWALRDVSLEIRKGEVFGLVGLNGAGKSTILKTVAGVLKPTQGVVETHGSIAPLIELGAGFDPDLTARENVYMNGAVLGYSSVYMKERYEEIMDFAELENCRCAGEKLFFRNVCPAGLRHRHHGETGDPHCGRNFIGGGLPVPGKMPEADCGND